MSPADARELQDRAHEILQDSRFHARRTPAPFRGLLEWLSDVLEPVGEVYADIEEFLARLWAETLTRVLLVAAVLAFASLLSVLVVKRRVSSSIEHADRRGAAAEDPREIEREAERAEQSGDYAKALRLRFRAGVIRLQLTGRVRRARSSTTRALARQLRSPAFDELGRRHDAIAYGGAPASAEDASAAREQWDLVLSEKAS